ncbi:MAG: hypothetical protein IT440_11260 [Phycisphaeraceae bacterium]|nr:hypothetical protein [Phycisphaeraceae bacterium]
MMDSEDYSHMRIDGPASKIFVNRAEIVIVYAKVDGKNKIDSSNICNIILKPDTPEFTRLWEMLDKMYYGVDVRWLLPSVWRNVSHISKMDDWLQDNGMIAIKQETTVGHQIFLVVDQAGYIMMARNGIVVGRGVCSTNNNRYDQIVDSDARGGGIGLLRRDSIRGVTEPNAGPEKR